MRILLRWAGGHLGNAFRPAAAGKHDVVRVYTLPPGAQGHAVDLVDAARVVALVRDERPDWIVHGAAMTNEDTCETDPAAVQAVTRTPGGGSRRRPPPQAPSWSTSPRTPCSTKVP
jgi:dTDP-4-dehydrorhamnose reductase